MDEDEKPKLILANPDASGASESDGDSAQPVEVVFEKGQSHRRKSSFYSSVGIPSRPSSVSRKSTCFVHSFLQDHRLQRGKGPQEVNHDGQEFQSIDKMPGDLEDTMRSRLLTKKELSDMAFGIRELSKRLSHFKLKLKVKSVFLLTKAHDETLIAYTREVAEWLFTEDSGGPYTVWVEDKLKDNKIFDAKGLIESGEVPDGKLRYWNNEICKRQPNKFDIVLALGGDGTVLYASWLFQRIVPPVLSFALGSLGFLTKFDFASYQDTLKQAFHKGLTVSLRLRLEATVMRAQKNQKRQPQDLIEELLGQEAEDNHTHKPEMSHDILNDLVMDRGPNATMSSIEVFGDNFHITTMQADGVVVATPTGSTAYNLAAGGSLCHPDNPVVLLTAICAHTLSFRPIILPDTIVLRLGVPYDARANPWLSFDGKERIELGPGDYVTISASRFPFPTVLPLGRGSEDWIDSLSRTLNWNSRQRQKAFKNGEDERGKE